MFHAKNKMLVDISRRMGRTDSALPMKLSNLASIDPEFIITCRKGLWGWLVRPRAIWAVARYSRSLGSTQSDLV